MPRRHKEGLLPFKVVPTEEPLVARSGLLLPYELVRALKLAMVIDIENYPNQAVDEAISRLSSS